MMEVWELKIRIQLYNLIPWTLHMKSDLHTLPKYFDELKNHTCLGHQWLWYEFFYYQETWQLVYSELKWKYAQLLIFKIKVFHIQSVTVSYKLLLHMVKFFHVSFDIYQKAASYWIQCWQAPLPPALFDNSSMYSYNDLFMPYP